MNYRGKFCFSQRQRGNGILRDQVLSVNTESEKKHLVGSRVVFR